MVESNSGLVGRYETALVPDPLSARAARRFVRAHLTDNALAEGLVDTAELLVSELVTNAVIHAGTAIGLVVNVFRDAVRVDVSDANPARPVRRSPHESATTGRGLQVVRLLADGCGVVGSRQGKVAWFSLGPAPALVENAELRRDSSPPGGHSVVLTDTPLDLFTVWQQHASASVRESMLMSFSPDPTSSAMAAAVVARANDAIGMLSRARPEISFDERLGRDRADVPLSAVDGLAARFADLKRVLERIVVLARDGTVLVPPAPPEIIHFRDWVCDEVVRQSNGDGSVPWPDNTPLTESFVDVPHLQWDVSEFADAPEALIAADDSNRIVAVSASAGSLLGWEPQELVGQRIISIIPERLHESHVVGFLRYLLTGQQVLVGSVVTVPARRADGTEISVDLSIQALPRTGGRTAFVAELSMPTAAAHSDHSQSITTRTD